MALVLAEHVEETANRLRWGEPAVAQDKLTSVPCTSASFPRQAPHGTLSTEA